MRKRRTELAALLELWQRTRSPRVADAIDLATRAVDEPVGDGLSQDHEDAWLARAAVGDPEDVPELLATLAWVTHPDGDRVPLPSRRVVTRLKLVARWKDPRAAMALAELLAKPPQRGAAGRPVMKLVLATLAELRDVRVVDTLEELASRYLGIVRGAYGVSLQRQLRDVVARLRTVEHDSLTEREAALCGTVEQRFPHANNARSEAAAKQRGADLLRLVHEHPEDDAARLVYADWLTERGDPRGELIALQLAGEQPERVRHLLAAHERGWVGNLAAATYNREFRRGFLSACVVGLADKKAIAAVAGDPVWSTVEEVTLGALPVRDEARLLGAPSMTALVRVHGVTPATFVEVFGGSSGRLRAVRFSGYPDADQLAVIAQAGLASVGFAVPPRAKFRDEEDAYPEQLPFAFAHPWPELVIEGNLTVQLWITAAERSSVGRYVHHAQEHELHFTRDAERRFSQLRVVATPTASVLRLGYALRTIAPDALSSLDLSALPYEPRELRPLADRFRRATCRLP